MLLLSLVLIGALHEHIHALDKATSTTQPIPTKLEAPYRCTMLGTEDAPYPQSWQVG